MRLAECSHLAMRVYLHLFWGEDSEKPGFGRCAPSLLADTLDSSKRAVVTALDELQSKGLIVWSADERLAYRPGFAQRFKPAQPAMVNNWHDTAARLRDGVIASQVREEIGPRVELHYERSKKSNSKPNTEYLSIPSVSSVSSVSTIPSNDLPADAGAPVKPTPTRTDKRVDELIAAYNEARQGRMPQCAGTELQRKDIAAALKRDPVPIWIARIQRACKSSLLKGDKGDWRADLSWILKPRNAEKIDAGNYDDSGPTSFALAGPRGNAPAKPEGRDDTDHLLKLFGGHDDKDDQ